MQETLTEYYFLSKIFLRKLAEILNQEKVLKIIEKFKFYYL